MSGDVTEIETSIEVQNVKLEPTYDHDIFPATILECKMETEDIKPDPLCLGNVKLEPTDHYDIFPETFVECKMEPEDLKPDPLLLGNYEN